ncbi:uncharacterized protein CLUP02_02688 [Colletotrichum lupini]|uniref:Uncharacterized protein n=1 Tax=Colletotrichum lupini TaxID=145971 RepID=A0A9Q8SH03_9PEZI|nr:uncharacterized protein CLUP02_02688 [Colletotrichum lupini]UQC77221.1 hypothetical protein CLUP02_02688 [Colletotrichum lupini]
MLIVLRNQTPLSRHEVDLFPSPKLPKSWLCLDEDDLSGAEPGQAYMPFTPCRIRKGEWNPLSRPYKGVSADSRRGGYQITHLRDNKLSSKAVLRRGAGSAK